MNILDEIEATWQNTQGWCSLEKALTYSSIVLATRPDVCVSIGVWYGRSLFPVAQALKHIGKGTVLAIDPWQSHVSASGQDNPADKEWWNRQEIHDEAYRDFFTKVHHTGLSPFVNIHRKPSNDVEPPTNIGFLEIDGNHGEQVIHDVMRFATKVKPGGFVAMDDLGWTGGHVALAVNQLVLLGFKELYRVVNDKENWAVFQKL